MEIVELLLEYGADPYELCSLIMAARTHLGIYNLLLESVDDPKYHQMRLESRNNRQKLLAEALKFNRQYLECVDITAILIESGANENI